ncbi:MAG: peptidoglycan D,D-transpeptidase FtsI family protein [Planctomycetota bacterium]
MYDKRIKIFVCLTGALVLLCVFRLIYMQLVPDSLLQESITELKVQAGHSRQLRTIRGRILDREGRVLASDEPRFQVLINYELSRFMDDRVRRARLLRAAKRAEPDKALANAKDKLDSKSETLEVVIEKCVHFGLEREEAERKINKINEEVWNRRMFQAWARNYADKEFLEKYGGKKSVVPLSEALRDFAQKEPNQDKRILLAAKVDIAEMHRGYPLLGLETDDDIFTAQLELLGIEGVEIVPKGRRIYHYGSVAAQTIGWVGPEHERELFKEDRFSKYLEGEVSGRRPGVEYVCEEILRGRRGEVVYDIDRQLQNKVETEFGEDVRLTIDIELQRRIEEYIQDCNLNPNCRSGTAAVLIEVASGEILSLVSLPDYDLNRIRYDYGAIAGDSNQPLLNRALYKQYPPGSVVKPLILIAGLEEGVIGSGEVISCPASKAPRGWPSCWYYNRYNWTCHDERWTNVARNAIRGSCNIYFSRLANRIEPLALQSWLYKFGYGHRDAPGYPVFNGDFPKREFLQGQGQISNVAPKGRISSFEQLSALTREERRYFGIGQGNMQATPLQVANAMAVIARGGLYKAARLFIEEEVEGEEPRAFSRALDISAETMAVVYDGMSAVVNEEGGTAYGEFAYSGFGSQGVQVYGKTGSTEGSVNAWFAGFAEDGSGRSISFALVVEGVEHGSRDAAPLVKNIIQFCIEAGHIGQGGLAE